MRLGILTFHSSYNFGANLQALATQEALRARGVDPVVINYRDPSKVAIYRKVVSARQAERHEAFCEQLLQQSPVLSSSAEVERYCCENLDGVLVGSDAVFSHVARYDPRQWIRRITGRRAKLTFDKPSELPAYFLDWQRRRSVRPVKAALAASATGTPFYFLSWRDYWRLFRALRDFDHLSVRDRWTHVMVSALTLGRQTVVHSPDPVFSLNHHFECPGDTVGGSDLSRTVLVSGRFRRPWLDELVSHCHEAGYLVANLPNPEDEFGWDGADWRVSLPLDPLQWYGLLAGAAGFVGIRFHALVSCLANQTPAIAVDTGPPVLRPGYRFASKYRDVMYRAGLLERYHDKRTILTASPASILPRLADQNLNQLSLDYARVAAEQFEDNLTAILQRCESQCAEKEGHVLLCQ